jgi:hypothetical protein
MQQRFILPSNGGSKMNRIVSHSTKFQSRKRSLLNPTKGQRLERILFHPGLSKMKMFFPCPGQIQRRKRVLFHLGKVQRWIQSLFHSGKGQIWKSPLLFPLWESNYLVGSLNRERSTRDQELGWLFSFIFESTDAALGFILSDLQRGCP